MAMSMASHHSNDQSGALYGVDYSGRVWTFNANSKTSTGWSMLPVNNRLDIKRLTSISGIVWAISSDHQIYVFVPKRDVPIRVREEVYENERWNPVNNFCDQLLPTDRPHFSDETGLINRDKSYIKLPSDSWQWESDWQIVDTFENQLLSQDGWTYAIDFPANYKSEKSWNSMVRRRKLYHYRRYVAHNRWNKIEAIYEDHTKEPFVDVSVSRYGNSEMFCLWAVSVLGQIYFRSEVSENNPEGSYWHHIEIPKGLEACQVGVSGQGVPFIVTWTGSFLFRTGLTPHNLSGSDWIEIGGPTGGLFQVSVGENTMWAITRDKKCWTLKGTVQDVFKSSSSAAEWLEIPGKLKCISVSRNDQNVLAVCDEEGVVLVRYGIADDQRHGQQWKEAFPEVSWDSISVCSRMSEVDSIDGSGDTSTASIRPDLPPQTQFNLSSGSESGDTVSLCWIDGACLSAIKSRHDGDLEVGPWREEILTNLQSLKVGTEKFDYPNAVESRASSWSKSVKARMIHKSKKEGGVNGELEISNNDTLVFHKSMQNSWICSVRDVLSVILDSEACISFSLRIRNSFEDGRAEIVSFRFSNEKECEEWRTAIVEISLKPQEQCKLANLWLTTDAGEIHQCGQIKIAETPSEMDIITPAAGDNLKFHHPLVRGFCVGSELRIDISIPADAERFAFNFKGNDDTAFHFNPRLDVSQVVRNSYDKGEWGEEERDGVFPFLKGQNYEILFQCSETHFITIVTKKHKFVFAFKHRILPRNITTFTAVGDVTVNSIRYDPANPEDVERLEFISNPIPGHFWKLTAASNGMVWTLSYDMAVWVYLLNSKKSLKLESNVIGPIHDEKVFHTYENQRWNPISSFTSHGLPTDRHSWTDETGRIKLEKEDIKLPSNKWNWVTEWEVDFDLKEGVDKDGWQYAIDFPASYHPKKNLRDFVRRRRWKRVCRFTTDGPWNLVQNIKLVDICIWVRNFFEMKNKTKNV
ncbi:unnamed protein product [Orchesella dallaii]|uniref:Galectin domain-containing protein n=1 Tax=Orchesella dallaii TaxID=48710 RepID=A0ABP1RXS2_9HEXA